MGREHVYVLDRKPPSSRLKEDPFSIYDDDNSHTHYFFLPGKLGFNGFKRSEVSSEKVTCGGCDKPGTCSKYDSVSKMKKNHQIEQTINKSNENDYCFIDPNAIGPEYPALEKNGKDISLHSIRTVESRTPRYVSNTLSLTKDSERRRVEDCSCSTDEYDLSTDESKPIRRNCTCIATNEQRFPRWLWICFGALLLFIPCVISYIRKKISHGSSKLNHNRDETLKSRFCMADGRNLNEGCGERKISA